jgi:hypothetical protein
MADQFKISGSSINADDLPRPYHLSSDYGEPLLGFDRKVDVVQILSQDHTGFGVWLGDPFHDKESEQFVARYIERAPLSLEKLSIQDDIVTYTTKDGAAHASPAVALREGGSSML